jgi:alpha-ketoglutarate-dependent taurine dioxygenase
LQKIHPQLITKFITQGNLPFVIEPQDGRISLDEFLDLLHQENDFFKENLLKCGGLLFRNFPVACAEDFAAVIKGLNTGSPLLEYIGGDSPRTKIKDGVFTSTEAPPFVKIHLHNELSYVKHFPAHIYFFCDIQPLDRGETILADARRVYQAIDERVKEPLIEKGVRYVSCYHPNSGLFSAIKGHKSWMDVFETENPAEVESKCRENEFEFEWQKNHWLKISQVRPATLFHPQTQQQVWFNQAHLFDFSPRLLGFWKYLCLQALYCLPNTRLHQVFYGDGTKIPRTHLSHILDVLDAHTIKFPWKRGDVLVLDNILSMHGREVFTGKRRILTAMTGQN